MAQRFTLFLIFFCLNLLVFGQSINTEFGKNRVQHHDDFNNWWMYETENFITYWYGKGRNIAQFVVQMSEYDHEEIQGIMEHRMNDKIEIIVYLDVSDLKQSNIGTEETFESSWKRTRIIGNKMFVYFDGNHRNLRRKIREGIATVYLNSMLSGTSLQELVQNTLFLDVPQWYQLGLVSYLGSYWDHLIDDEFRDIWSRQNGYYTQFDKLSRDHPRVAGHSLWYYLDQAYGKSTISNLLYLIRINRNLDNSFLFVFGVPFDRILEEWQIYYANHFAKEEGKFSAYNESAFIPLGNKNYQPISMLRISPSGQSLAYAYNDQGKYRVNLLDLKSGDVKTVFKYGYRNSIQETDYTYPLVAWHPNSSEITIAYEHRDIIRLRKYDLLSGKTIEQDLPEEYHRVYSISYVNDLDYLLSASTDGYSDLYLYQSKGRVSDRLTEDYHDDIEASYAEVNGVMGILFASNRQGAQTGYQKLDTLLPIGHYDLYFYDYINHPGKILQLTDTPNESERQPAVVGNNNISFLSEKSGMVNRYVGPADQLDLSYCTSNFSRNLILHHTVKDHLMSVQSFYHDGAYKAYLEFPDWSSAVIPFTTPFQAGILKSAPAKKGLPFLPEKKEEPQELFKNEYLFQSEFEDPKNLEPIEEPVETLPFKDPFDQYRGINLQEQSDVLRFYPARAIAARTKFKIDDLAARLDNEVLFEGLESYAGDDKELETTPVGILLKAKVKDLFEDYVFEGGVRIPTTFNGSEYFFTFDNNKKLIDKRFAIYRKTETNSVTDSSFPVQKTKRSSLLGLYRLKYPFDVYRSVRATAILRLDKFFYLASDANTSSIPAVNEKRAHLRLEYVFDNTMDLDLNLKVGTRYKFYVEAINRFDLQLVDNFSFDFSRGYTAVIGLDARHYINLFKHSVFALRGAAATSLGSDKILYYLGGAENWVVPQFDDNIPLPGGENFAYKAIAAHVRGFKHNIRNGATYVLTNAEFRLPIFKYLRKRQIRSAFFRNFQLIAFYDAGLAWHGLSPNGDENPINTVFLENPPVIQVKVDFFRDPLVMGYGVGLRSSLFGYFLRLDYAWGIESRAIQDPILYFSLGLDF